MPNGKINHLQTLVGKKLTKLMSGNNLFFFLIYVLSNAWSLLCFMEIVGQLKVGSFITSEHFTRH